MAAGHFYAPPPVFIGGRQPYAPRLGLPQSVPGLTIPPARSFVSLGIVHSWWTHDPITTVWLTSIAPFLAEPGPPPKRTLHAFFSIRETWNPPTPLVPKRVAVASILATPPAIDAPPPQNLAAYYALRRLWDPLPYALPEGASFAPLTIAPVSDAPPPATRAVSFAVREHWDAAPFELPERVAIAPLLAPDVPPPQTSVRAMLAIRESWNVTLPLPQIGSGVAASGPSGAVRSAHGVRIPSPRAGVFVR